MLSTEDHACLKEGSNVVASNEFDLDELDELAIDDVSLLLAGKVINVEWDRVTDVNKRLIKNPE
jgi:hypothetical protein